MEAKILVCGMIGLVIVMFYISEIPCILERLKSGDKSFQSIVRDLEEGERRFSRIMEEACFGKTRGFFSNIKTDTFWGIEIRGTEDFIFKTKGALLILMNSGLFSRVKGSLRCIDQTAGFGMHVDSKIFGLAGHDDITFPPIYYAAAIAHDTYHSYLYQQGETWNGTKGERQCVEFEFFVLDELCILGELCAEDREVCFLRSFLIEVRRILMIRELNGFGFDGWEAIGRLANRAVIEE